MVLINKAINEVTVKLVYYGPGLCGKTTNLEKIYANPKLDNKGKLISMSTETDRTLFFDFMPMELGTIGGQKIRVQLYTVPGQVFYDATRKLVLRGADGVVFVADSQDSMRDSNIDSLENLRTNLRLNRLDPDKIALVFQYNKRDLPNAASVADMSAYLHPGNAPVVEASAITGVGVTATLRAAVTRILDNVKNDVDTTLYDQAPLLKPDMTQKSGSAQHSAGTPKVSMRTEAPAAAAAPPPAPAAPAPAPEPEPSRTPTAPPFESPFSVDMTAFSNEEDPFGQSAPEPEFGDVESETPVDLFADEPEPAPVHDERAELQAMLANARALVATLEGALERARESERLLAAKLGE
jgi:signal recognition particle receptor subunit beta